MNTSKKQKAPKIVYSPEEEDWLVENALIYSSIIENKKTDGATNREKDQAWEKIANAYNVAMPGKERTLKSLREKYTKIKQSLRDCARDAKTTACGPPKKEPPLSEPMQQLAALLASSHLGLPAQPCDSDYLTANTTALGSTTRKRSSSAEHVKNICMEELILDEDVKFLDGEQSSSSEATVQPVKSTCTDTTTRLDEDAAADCSWERVNPAKLRTPLTAFWQNRRRKMSLEQMLYKKQRMNDKMHEYSIKRQQIEIEILSSERERYQLEREGAALELKRATAECEQAEIDRERAAVELQRSEQQLRFEQEIHQIRLANLQTETVSMRSKTPTPSTAAIKEECQ